MLFVFLSTMDYKKQLGDVIRIYRDKKHITQEVLSDKLGVTQQMVTAYEKGKSAMYMDTAMEISDILDIPMSKFFEDAEYRDLLNEFKDLYYKYSETIEAIDNDRKLKTSIEVYRKNAKTLKDVDLPKLLSKLATLSSSERKTIIKLILK